MTDAGGPLAGVRVIDCSTILAGPLACQILGDFGADVIKVEHPDQPDGLRTHGVTIDGHGLWWKEVGRNKRTVAVDLGSVDGADLLRQMVVSADVLVENFRPGTFERWGLGPDRLIELNPGLVILRVTGFGQTGPYAERRAFGTLAEAMSGFAHLTGAADGPPTLPPFGLADTVTAYLGVGAITMALYHRDARGGAGQVIDLSILESMISAVGPAPSVYHATGVVGRRQGNSSPNNAPRNLYRTLDGSWVAVSASALAVARRVMEVVGHPEVAQEEWFASGSERAARRDMIDGLVSSWIAERGRDDVMTAFESAGAAIAAVYDPADIVADPQVQHRQILVEVPDRDLGDVLMHNVLFRMSETPGSIRHPGRGHGQDSEEVLTSDLGLDPARIAELRAAGVVR